MTLTAGRIDATDLDLQGLRDDEVVESRRVHGSNTLTPPPRDPEWRKLLEKFDDPTIRILLIAAALSLITATISIHALGGHGTYIDGLGILVAVSLATTVAYLNERKSSREFDLLNRVKEDVPVKVTRYGEFRKISIHDVVVGDLVHLNLGDKVSTDGRVVATLGLTVDESLLTGEAEPIEKSVLPPPDQQTNLKADHVYRGTMVVDGHGVYVTTAVGDATEMGKIAQTLQVDEDDTPLQQKLTALAGQISAAGTAAAFAIFSVMSAQALWRSPLAHILLQDAIAATAIAASALAVTAVLAWRPFRLSARGLKALNLIPLYLASLMVLVVVWAMFRDASAALDLINAMLLSFVVAVTIVVVAVPEGLPMMVNVSLALNMRKMARQNCLVRKLVASETIGSATVICTDKTGTLTQNRMQPVWFFLGLRQYPSDQIDVAARTPEWSRLVQNVAVNSSCDLVRSADGVAVAGNPTEGALLRLLNDRGIDYRGLRDAHPALHQIDYNSARKMSVAVIEDGSQHSCFAKGAPEQIIAGCASVHVGDTNEPIAAHLGTIYDALAQATGRDALRVIAFSEKVHQKGDCPDRSEAACMNCQHRTLLGLVGIADPLREDVREAVRICKAAGIQVKVVTGDDRRTAEAIARQAGILEPGGLSLVSADCQRMLTDQDAEACGRLQVLARSSPTDKLRLVQTLKRSGEVVAVTGDGTNDAPALKVADVGLSMGLCGTEVAKEASDIVLVDDNFSSIVTGVRWGRALYSNIQRFLQFQLSVNVVALLSALLGPLVGVPLPLTVPQLLWINIIMDTFAALALSTEPPRARSMSRPPIRRDADIITSSMKVTILFNSLYQVAVLMFVLLANPFQAATEGERLTVFFTVFVMFQFWHKFNCRSLYHDESPFHLLLRNRNFLAIVGTITVVQVFMVQVGGGVGRLFRTMPLPAWTWIWILVVTASILPVAWLGRYVAYWVGAEERVA
jgi:Ca2+-transporting ATPase